MNKFSLKERFWEMFKFGVNGGVCFLIDYFIMIALTEWVHIPVLISTAISFTISVIVNYLICVIWVFKGAKEQTNKAKILFFVTSLIGLGWNQLLMWIAVDLLFIHYMIAKVIVAILVMVWNYIMKRKVLKMDNA